MTASPLILPVTALFEILSFQPSYGYVAASSGDNRACMGEKKRLLLEPKIGDKSNTERIYVFFFFDCNIFIKGCSQMPSPCAGRKYERPACLSGERFFQCQYASGPKLSFCRKISNKSKRRREKVQSRWKSAVRAARQTARPRYENTQVPSDPVPSGEDDDSLPPFPDLNAMPFVLEGTGPSSPPGPSSAGPPPGPSPAGPSAGPPAGPRRSKRKTKGTQRDDMMYPSWKKGSKKTEVRKSKRKKTSTQKEDMHYPSWKKGKKERRRR